MNQVISSSNNSDVKYTDPTKLYKFNDAFSRLYFGYSLAEIAQGGAKVVPYVLVEEDFNLEVLFIQLEIFTQLVELYLILLFLDTHLFLLIIFWLKIKLQDNFMTKYQPFLL